MAIFFLSHNVDIANALTKQFNFCTTTKQVHKGVLTQANVSILNKKVVTGLTLNDLLNNIVIVQQNKTKYLINQL